MKRFESDEELVAALRDERPEPEEKFASELDARAAAGFPRRGRAGRVRGLLDRLRAVQPRRIAMPVGAAALVAIAVATAAISLSEEGSGGDRAVVAVEDAGQGGTEGSQTERSSGLGPTLRSLSAPAPGGSQGFEYQDGPTIAPGRGFSDQSGKFEYGGKAGRRTAHIDDFFSGVDPASPGRGRAIERSASLVLEAEPAELPGAAAEVFEAVRAENGIVLRSEIEDGEEPSASFELLIPSGRVSDAMGSLSAIAAVRERNDRSADITAPTVGAAERVRDSRARIESLLGQLAEAGDETERAAVERRLRAERRSLAFLERQLSGLRDRARMSRVSLRIETPGASPGTGWGVADALDDAGDVLAVAAGVTIVGIAVLGPIALLLLIAWLARRAWLAAARRRALG